MPLALKITMIAGAALLGGVVGILAAVGGVLVYHIWKFLGPVD